MLFIIDAFYSWKVCKLEILFYLVTLDPMAISGALASGLKLNMQTSILILLFSLISVCYGNISIREQALGQPSELHISQTTYLTENLSFFCLSACVSSDWMLSIIKL